MIYKVGFQTNYHLLKLLQLTSKAVQLNIGNIV